MTRGGDLGGDIAGDCGSKLGVRSRWETAVATMLASRGFVCCGGVVLNGVLLLDMSRDARPSPRGHPAYESSTVLGLNGPGAWGQLIGFGFSIGDLPSPLLSNKFRKEETGF